MSAADGIARVAARICVNGHSLAAENALREKKPGYFVCRLCDNEGERLRVAERAQVLQATGKCNKGHDLTLPGATRIRRDGVRYCVTCRRAKLKGRPPPVRKSRRNQRGLDQPAFVTDVHLWLAEQRKKFEAEARARFGVRR